MKNNDYSQDKEKKDFKYGKSKYFVKENRIYIVNEPKEHSPSLSKLALSYHLLVHSFSHFFSLFNLYFAFQNNCNLIAS